MPKDGRSGLLEAIVRAIDRIGALGGHVGNLCMWALAAMVTYDVALRTFGEPTLWAAEVSLYTMIGLAFLGAGATQAVDGHFRVSFLRDMFGPRGRAFLDALSLVVALGFALLFTAGAWSLASFSWLLDLRTPTILQFPLWVLQGFMVVGGLLLSLATLRDLLLVVLHGSMAGDAGQAGGANVM